jgi:hypothetical protein
MISIAATLANAERIREPRGGMASCESCGLNPAECESLFGSIIGSGTLSAASAA